MDERDGGGRRVGVVVLETVADLVDGEDDGGDDEQQPDDSSQPVDVRVGDVLRPDHVHVLAAELKEALLDERTNLRWFGVDGWRRR